MEMDTVDLMLNRVGDYTPDVNHYVPLRQRLRRDFGGPHRPGSPNRALLLLEEVIERHLVLADNQMAESVGKEGDGGFLDECMEMVPESLFQAGRKISTNNLISDILVHAAFMKKTGKHETMYDEFVELVTTTAEAM